MVRLVLKLRSGSGCASSECRCAASFEDEHCPATFRYSRALHGPAAQERPNYRTDRSACNRRTTKICLPWTFPARMDSRTRGTGHPVFGSKCRARRRAPSGRALRGRPTRRLPGGTSAKVEEASSGFGRYSSARGRLARRSGTATKIVVRLAPCGPNRAWHYAHRRHVHAALGHLVLANSAVGRVMRFYRAAYTLATSLLLLTVIHSCLTPRISKAKSPTIPHHDSVRRSFCLYSPSCARMSAVFLRFERNRRNTPKISSLGRAIARADGVLALTLLTRRT